MSMAILCFAIGHLVEKVSYLETVGVLLDHAINQIVSCLCLHLFSLLGLFLALRLRFGEGRGVCLLTLSLVG